MCCVGGLGDRSPHERGQVYKLLLAECVVRKRDRRIEAGWTGEGEGEGETAARGEKHISSIFGS